MHVSTFWKFLGRVAEPTVRRTGQPRLPLLTQPCSSSRSSRVYSGMKILWPRGHSLAQALWLPRNPPSLTLGVLAQGSWASGPEAQAHTVRTVGSPTPPHPEARPPRGSHSLEVAGMGEESLRKGNVGLQDKDLDCPHNQHVGLEDVGTGGSKTLGRERSVGGKNMQTWGWPGPEQRAQAWNGGQAGLDQSRAAEPRGKSAPGR